MYGILLYDGVEPIDVGAAFGVLSPILGAAAMALSDVCVIGNSLLLPSKRLS